MFRECRIVLKNMFISSVWCFVLCSLITAARVRTNIFKEFKSLSVKVQMSDVGAASDASSVVSCAIECMSRESACYSFLYDSTTKSCTLGSFLVPYDNGGDAMRGTFYYVPGTLCDNTQVNFTVRSSATVSSCLWISDDTLSYQNATDKCRALGASMYTMKVKEKLDLLINAVQAGLFPWIGLDDIKQESVFRWSDDNSILNVSWTIWQTGQPNNDGNQDCVYYSSSHQLVNDWGCNDTFNYVCEMNPYVL